MRFLMTAVLFSIACLTFAGCGMDEEENDAYWANVYSELETGREWKIRTRYQHRDYLEYVDEFTRRIHVSDCKRWNWKWDRLPYQDANYWQGRYGDEVSKPRHKWNLEEAMTDPDTGIRYHIGGWLRSGGVIMGICCFGD